jgi:cyclopropane-fatty-acyl-phospholipid synthase
MKGSKAESAIKHLLASADIQIQGGRPWDLQIHHPGFFERLITGGTLALGESYMDGWWDCEALDRFFNKIIENRVDEKASAVIKTIPRHIFKAMLVNAQSKTKSFIIGKHHYDLGNDLFSVMLDRGLNYSCGFWDQAENLDQAQEAKCELICRKINLKPGMRVLDIGCGWGGFARYAASRYDARVYGVTVSGEQAEYAKQCCDGLCAEFELKDYRDINDQFDAVVSVGMFEHVGYKNYRTYMNVVNRCLKPEGVFLLHTIGGKKSSKAVDPWIEKYIFPNSMLPSAKQITAAAEGLLVLEDWHNFGLYYDKTLMAWYENFKNHWDDLKSKYDERFYRMWTYYLLSCAGSFRARQNQLWQIVFSKNGINGVFRTSDRYYHWDAGWTPTHP